MQKKAPIDGPGALHNVIQDLVSAVDMWNLLHVLDGLESEHRGYKMKNAELFRNGQSKPEVLKESKEW